ncbi:MAG TPA: holo-ACP synthase [Terriglobales bacterium]|nr:holo-ACP synthase [Terriglobales bacterium]
MIVAIGTDIVDIHRIRAALENPATGSRFRDRLFTPGEIAYCSRRRRCHESYAARFAAKEAVIKALGGKAVRWLDIDIRRQEEAPEIHLSGSAAALANELGIDRWHLSLSHSEDLAIAYVIAEASRRS